jgi:hypothetical protein
MLTNSDIGLTKDFYSSYLLPKLHRRSKSTNNNNTSAHALSLSINRLTIPMTKQIQVISNKYNNNDNDNNNIVESESLSKILLNTIDNDIELGFGLIHPGYDCFVMHSSILKNNKKQINLGNMFAGYPPWGTILKKILKNMAGGKSNNNSYANYKSSPNGTYHIGNDGSKWNKKKVVSMSESSNDNFTNIITNNNSTVVTEAEAESEIIILKQQQRKQQQQDQKDYYDTILQNCPSKLIGTHPYTYLNTINCGLLWSNTSNMKMSTTSTTETSSNSTMNT